MSGELGNINDNPLSVLPGNAINFPRPSINSYGPIQRVLGSPNQFILPGGGIYEITFQVGIQNTGELLLVLNGVEQLFTVVGKSGGGVVVGISIISTPAGLDSTLSVNNPSTAVAGGLKVDEATGALSQPLSCHLIIKKLG
jgi:hypothetical protein